MWGRGKSVLTLLVIFGFSCNSNRHVFPKWPIPIAYIAVKVTAQDLSEDMSRLSTGEDEVVLLIYDYEKQLKEPLLMNESQYFKGDYKTFNLSIQSDTLLLFLIEKDSDRALVSIEAAVRENAFELIKAADENDFELEDRILIGDDLLAYQLIDSSKRNFILEGRKVMDRYVYEISVSPKEPNR